MRATVIVMLAIAASAAGCSHTGNSISETDARPPVMPGPQSPLVGSWEVVKGNELPSRPTQLQFEADVYLSSLDFLPDGSIRVKRIREVGGRESVGSWQFFPDDENEGMLFLTYPQWPNASGTSKRTNKFHTSVLLRGSTIILENLSRRPLVLERRTGRAQQDN